ncbi:site-2 protease family protein [Microcystis aeruginosa EAWAG127a]|uniref:Site-2 protease family protein n=1 Tax=Microcystis aeruginosa EAWAG127a TaxID=2529855 RepID=A0A5J5LUW6_MICAE|nr:site-2 protease family protein [Microcystis aeruginosa]KAB0241288.1 site-2 protease family protein [Microcystis aeruginosa EAWAG127a]MDB9417140.1 site-2 protease family protein [Microcystis aeruginosa CS-556/03]
MVNISSEIAAIAVIFLVAGAILTWSFYRSKPYGQLGILAWLQSLVLIAPWLIFFGLFAAGIKLNLAVILFLLVASTIIYIYLGKRLRLLKSSQIIETKVNPAVSQSVTPLETPVVVTAIVPDVIPVPEEDLKVIQSIFGIDTFFATETISFQEGAIFKGNLRGEPDSVHLRLTQKLSNHFGDKYRLFLVEGTEEKPVVIILPKTNDPSAATLAQKNLSLVLLVATIVTSLEAAGILLGFDLFSNWQRYREAIPLSLGLWSVLIAHEIGHLIIAKRHNIRLSLPYFLPTWQIGSFGAITRFESLLPNRSVLFDIAFAGPALGGLVSLILLIVGLTLSNSASLFHIPSNFFQSSILVSFLARIVLGDQLQNAFISVHPLTVIGWLGLVITALNLLPAGQLDGGRIVQAIYGRKIARRTTVATLVILGIISLVNPSNPIPLYWTILVAFLQRELERPNLNELTEPDDTRAGWGLLLLFLMLATLIPLSPSLAGRLGIGG